MTFLNRAESELHYEKHRLGDIIRSPKFMEIFPEKISTAGLENQPYVSNGSIGVNGIFNSNKELLIIGGPCILSSNSTKEAILNAKNRASGKITNEEYLKNVY